MREKRFSSGNNWKIFGLVILILSASFSVVYLVNNQTSIINAESSCPLPLANTTFLKSYRLLALTKINGAWPTKDGGYIVSGTTDPNIMFIPPDGFVAKLDKQGVVKWLKLLKTSNAAGVGNTRGDEDVQSIIELKNGGYLMASKVWGFITTAESSASVEVNKILFTRLDKNGNMLWSKSFTAAVEDAKNSLLETADKGFLFYANMLDLAPDQRGEDSDVYMDMPFASLKVLKLDQNGNLQWSKNIKNFISRENDSYLIPTPDGGYALAGNIAETNLDSPPYNFDAYPGLVKFDKDFNFQWAKSLEGTPIDMAVAIPKADGGFEMGWKKWRQGASIIHGLVQTQDNGYLVLGAGPSALSLVPNIQAVASGKQSGLIGFKFDSSGNLAWVKKMALSFNDFTSPMINFSVASTTDNKIMLVGPITWAGEDYLAKVKNASALRDSYCVKYQISEEKCKANQIENIKDSKQTEADWDIVEAAYIVVQEAFRPGIFMMKMDQEMSPSWAKIINPQRGASNYVIKPTSDSGAIIGGEYVTNAVRTILFGEKIYYTDGFLMKLDASGNVKDNKNWIIYYKGEIVTELMTPYAVSNDLSVQADAYLIKLIKRVPTFSLYSKAKTSTYAPYKSSPTTLCPLLPAVSAYDAPLQNSNNPSTEPRTWPQINYEKAVPAELVNDKSRTVHNELLPILNQLYNNQVKMIDNMGGAMLSYVFDRVITKDDITAVKNYLEGLGYKTQDEGTYELTTYKPGYFLILTFSANNAYKAFLDVTY